MSLGKRESVTQSPAQIATILQSRETFNDQLDINQNCIDFSRGNGSSDVEPGLSRCDARRDTAAAVALVAAPMPSTVGGVRYTLNASTYRGEQSIGLSMAYRANTENPFAVTGGVSYSGGKSVAARVGVI